MLANSNSSLRYDTVRVHPNAKNPTDPKGLYTLSNLDQALLLPFDILFAFQTNNSLFNVDVGGILKESLSKALEVYYPLAGRLKMGLGGKMVVDCDVEGGVPFAEAFFDEDMVVAVGDITMIDRTLAMKLAYNNQTPYETGLDVPPLTIQVNRFRCGGMILGLRFNHVMFDGTGLTDFMKSWSEIARGLRLSIKPHLDRSILSPRKPPKDHFPHQLEKPLTPPLPHEREQFIVNKSFIFTPTTLTRLRELAMQNNNKNEAVSRAPTTFELISALTWIFWTKAKKLGPDETSQIGIALDGRHKLQPPMPTGYFGNCIVKTCAQSRAQDLMKQPLSYAVGVLHDAIKAMTGDYIRSIIDFLEITRKPINADNKVMISKWTRLPFYEIDFGWGVASQVAPGAIVEDFAYLLFHGKDNKNLVLSVTLPSDAMEVFQGLITSQLKDD
ncbi:hypothetical protein ACS0TY_019202 [Phlomoides rotata]